MLSQDASGAYSLPSHLDLQQNWINSFFVHAPPLQQLHDTHGSDVMTSIQTADISDTRIKQASSCDTDLWSRVSMFIRKCTCVWTINGSPVTQTSLFKGHMAVLCIYLPFSSLLSIFIFLYPSIAHPLIQDCDSVHKRNRKTATVCPSRNRWTFLSKHQGATFRGGKQRQRRNNKNCSSSMCRLKLASKNKVDPHRIKLQTLLAVFLSLKCCTAL